MDGFHNRTYLGKVMPVLDQTTPGRAQSILMAKQKSNPSYWTSGSPRNLCWPMQKQATFCKLRGYMAITTLAANAVQWPII
jgi:hypothetical protein